MVWMALAMIAREGPTIQDKGECLMAATGHFLEDMTATFHQPGVAGGWQAKLSNIRFAFRQLWTPNIERISLARLQEWFLDSGDADTP